MPDKSPTSEIAQAVQDVTTRAQLIIQEEIELAKAEVTAKVTKLARGAAIGIACGVFVLGGLIYFLHSVAWGLSSLLDVGVWLGYLIVAVVLFIAAAIAGLIAYKSVQAGSPPVPQMAIEEAQLVRQTLSEAQHAELTRRST